MLRVIMGANLNAKSGANNLLGVWLSLRKMWLECEIRALPASS